VYMSSWAKEASEGGVIEKNSREAATFWLNTRRLEKMLYLHRDRMSPNIATTQPKP
jgi:hypothetical protein